MKVQSVLCVALGVALVGVALAVTLPAVAQHGHGAGGTMHGGAMPAPSDAAAVEGKGVVNAIDVDGRSVNLSHEPIPSIGWPSMTMDMQVVEGVDLSGIADGAPVRFTLGRGADGIYVIDGDLIADIPTDPAKLVDPATLVFAYTPVEDPAVYAKVWDGFLKHMEKVTGKKVQFFPVQSNAAQIEAMRAGRLHVAGFNTGSNPLAVACAGFRAVRHDGVADGSFGYEMEIITYPGRASRRSRTSRARSWPSPRETSNSGFKAPSALLKAEFGMEPGATSSRCSPASTTTRSSASPTRTIRPPRSPTR
jgi:Cu/Ag efflux protein CusF